MPLSLTGAELTRGKVVYVEAVSASGAMNDSTLTLSLSATIAMATTEITHLDPIFAEFLIERYGAAAMASQPQFDLLAGFIENRGLAVRTRSALLDGADDLVGLHGDETPESARRLALTMFRILRMPEAADLRENLIGTDLPNLLGITSELPHQTAAMVFEGYESERNAVRAFLRSHKDADAEPLLAWIDAR